MSGPSSLVLPRRRPAAAGGRTPPTARQARTARGRILAAAERLFADRGFDHTSTALIAAEARVPQGLIFYHFKTKMELLLAVIREDQAALLDGLLPDGRPRMRACARRWPRCGGTCPACSVSPPRCGRSSSRNSPPTRRSASAPWNCTGRWPRCVARYLARAAGHPGDPLPEQEAAARLLTITAGMAPLLGEPSLTLIPPATLADLISDGLQPGRTTSARRQGALRSRAVPGTGPGLGLQPRWRPKKRSTISQPSIAA